MSLCCDFEKWTIITLASGAISLTFGLLMQYAHGYINAEEYLYYPEIYAFALRVNEFEKLVNYCYEHADRFNPIQDLYTKGLLSEEYKNQDCRTIKNAFDIRSKELVDKIQALDKPIIGPDCTPTTFNKTGPTTWKCPEGTIIK